MVNKKRLIDANDLIERLKFKKKISEVGLHRGLQSAMTQCDKAPTVDAVEVVHGKWVDKMVRDWHCSVCGKKVPRQVYFDGYCYNDKLNYCPNCGAKMDGDGNA